MKRKAFTLIELTVVMGVIALLMGLAVPNYMNYKEEVRVIDMENLQQDVISGAVTTGNLPIEDGAQYYDRNCST